MFQIGEKVKVFDNSWSLKLTDNGLKTTGDITNNKYIIVATGLKLPADCDQNEREFDTGNIIQNDTIVQSIQTREIVFTQSRFLSYYTCPTCGQMCK
jgi:hypothetical protein